MRIRIKDTAICDNCTKKTCSSGDVIEKNTFAKFRSERYTCPIRLFQYGPTDKQLDEGYIDICLVQMSLDVCIVAYAPSNAARIILRL